MPEYIKPEIEIIRFNITDVICALSVAPITPGGSERDNAYLGAGSLSSSDSELF